MGWYDIFCILCGCWQYIEYEHWINYCYILLPTGEIVGGFGDDWQFICDKTEYITIEFKMLIPELHKNNPCYGIFIHIECYKFIQKKFKIALNFKNFIFHKIPQYKIVWSQQDVDEFNKINYGIEKYQEQYFNYDKCPQWLYTSPFKNKQNAKRLINVFKFMLKKKIICIDDKSYEDSILDNVYYLKNNIIKNKSLPNIESKYYELSYDIKNEKKIFQIIKQNIFYKYEYSYDMWTKKIIKNPIFIINLKKKKIIFAICSKWKKIINKLFNKIDCKYDLKQIPFDNINKYI